MSNKTLLTVSLPENRQVADEYDKIVVKMYLQHQHNMQKCKERQQDNDVICEQNCSTFLICGTDPSVGTSSVALHFAKPTAKCNVTFGSRFGKIRKTCASFRHRYEKQQTKEACGKRLRTYIGKLPDGRMCIRRGYR